MGNQQGQKGERDDKGQHQKKVIVGEEPKPNEVHQQVKQKPPGKEPDPTTLLLQRITEYQKRFRSEEEKYSNASKLFRDVFFISEGQKINDIVFFDNGRTKPFRPLEEQVNERVDALFETTVSDPQNDKVLAEFIEEMKKKYKVIIPSEYPNRDDLDDQIKELSLSLCEEVKKFYDGNGQNIDQRCESRIQELKRKKKQNLIYLGELKGCGVCRHRSILFKLLCDIFGISCRILRGWFMFSGRSESHMWNEIIISKQRSLIVDSRLFLEFRAPQEEVQGILVTYRNLGHPQRSTKILQMNSDKLQKLYTENDGQKVREHLGELLGKPGAFGSVRELRNVEVIDEEFKENKWVRRTLAVKEVNISDLTRYETNDEAIERLERIIKKEVDRMTLLQHPNITRIFCHFCTEIDDEKIVRVVMKKYDKNGDELLKVLKKLGRSQSIKTEKRETEILIFLLEILKGLKYIHSFGIVHFDIKPQNILLNWDEKKMRISDVVISDFGSSKDEKMNFNLTSAPSITKQFAAPEILEMIYKKSLGQNVSDFVFTTSSDIYSFGVLMGAFLQYFDESDGKKKLMKIQSFCVKKNVNGRPKIEEIMKCVGEMLNKILENITPKYEGDVFTWGYSRYGSLGHGKEEDYQSSPKRIEKLCFSSSDIKNLFCGSHNICVLMVSGSVLSWGSNEYGQIGSDQIKCFSSPSFVLSLPERKIIQVSLDYYCGLYLDSEGSVWACGRNWDGLLTGNESDGEIITKPVEIISERMGFSKIVKICSSDNGYSHFFSCVDCEGRLFTWGDEDFYSLKGHGEEGKKKQTRPVLVSYFKDIPVRDCKMGEYVTLVLSLNGKVYSYGHKDCLGRKFEQESYKDWISTPGIIDELEDKKITKISTSGTRCGVIDSIGNCYLWGNEYSKLPTPIHAIQKFKNVSGDLISLEIPSKHRIVQVSCGVTRTIFLLEEKTETSKIVRHVLTSKKGSIPSVVTEFENKNVQKVCSKQDHYSVLVKRRK